MSGFQQPLGSVDIKVIALRLKVRAIRTADLRALVPVDAEPAEPVEDGLKCLGLVAFSVRVVDAQDELAAVPSGQQPVEQGGADAADVEITGGAGSKTCADIVHALSVVSCQLSDVCRCCS